MRTEVEKNKKEVVAQEFMSKPPGSSCFQSVLQAKRHLFIANSHGFKAT